MDDFLEPFAHPKEAKVEFKGATGEALGTTIDVTADKFGDMFSGILDGTKKVSDGFGAMAVDIIRSLAEIARNKAISNILSMLTSSIGGLFGGGGPYIPALAEGGTAMKGNAYMVGERGPELFMPGVTGQVIPNGSFGGGNSISVTNNVKIEGGRGGVSQGEGDQRNFADMIAKMISERTRQTLLEEMRAGGLLNRPSLR
jgi:phage-related minor tail protein